jgi:hypothetical protein
MTNDPNNPNQFGKQGSCPPGQEKTGQFGQQGQGNESKIGQQPGGFDPQRQNPPGTDKQTQYPGVEAPGKGWEGDMDPNTRQGGAIGDEDLTRRTGTGQTNTGQPGFERTGNQPGAPQQTETNTTGLPGKR